MNIDQYVNQRFSAHDAPEKINGSSHMFKWKRVFFYEMTYVDAHADVTISLGVSTCGHEGGSKWLDTPL